jgi:hypothetical protein
MDLVKTQSIESVFAGGGAMGARMRALARLSHLRAVAIVNPFIFKRGMS